MVKEGFWKESTCKVGPPGWVRFPWRCVKNEESDPGGGSSVATGKVYNDSLGL